MLIGRTIRFAKCLWLLVAVAPVAACGSISDFSIKDQQWFARPGKLFNQSSIEAPPLTTARAVTARLSIGATAMYSPSAQRYTS